MSSALIIPIDSQKSDNLDGRIIVEKFVQLLDESTYEEIGGIENVPTGLIASVWNDGGNTGVFELLRLPPTISKNWLRKVTVNAVFYTIDLPEGQGKRGVLTFL